MTLVASNIPFAPTNWLGNATLRYSNIYNNSFVNFSRNATDDGSYRFKQYQTQNFSPPIFFCMNTTLFGVTGSRVFGVGFSDATYIGNSVDILRVNVAAPNNYGYTLRTSNGGSFTDTTINDNSTNYVWCIDWTASNTSFYRDGQHVWSSTTNIPTISLPVMFKSNYAAFTEQATVFFYNLSNEIQVVSPLITSANDTGTLDFMVYRNETDGSATGGSSYGQTTAHPLSFSTINASFDTTNPGDNSFIGVTGSTFYKWPGTGANEFRCFGTNATSFYISDPFVVPDDITDYNLYQVKQFQDHVECWFNGLFLQEVTVIDPDPGTLTASGASGSIISTGYSRIENVLPDAATINVLANGSGSYSYTGTSTEDIWDTISGTVYWQPFIASLDSNHSYFTATFDATTNANFSNDGRIWYDYTSGTLTANNSHVLFVRFNQTPSSFTFSSNFSNTSNVDLPVFVQGANRLQALFSQLSSNQSTITSSFFARTNGSLYLQGFDELTQNPLNVTWTISNASNTTTWTNNTLYFNHTDIANGDLTITVTASGYQQRIYSLTFNEVTVGDLDAYLIPDNDDDLFVRFHVANAQQQTVVGAQTNISRNFAGTWTTVGQQDTDDSGIASFFMNINQQYRVNVSATGYNAYSATITPSTNDYYITLTTVSTTNFSTIFHNFSLNLTPTAFNNTQMQLVNLSVFDSDALLIVTNLTLYFPNNSVLYTANITNTSGGVIAVNVNTSNRSPYILANVSYNRTGLGFYTFNRTYLIANYSNHSYSWDAAIDSINDSGMSTVGKGIIILLVSIAVTAWVNRYAPQGYSALIGVLTLTFFTGLLEGWESALLLGGIIALIWVLYKGLARR